MIIIRPFQVYTLFPLLLNLPYKFLFELQVCLLCQNWVRIQIDCLESSTEHVIILFLLQHAISFLSLHIEWLSFTVCFVMMFHTTIMMVHWGVKDWSASEWKIAIAHLWEVYIGWRFQVTVLCLCWERYTASSYVMICPFVLGACKRRCGLAFSDGIHLKQVCIVPCVYLLCLVRGQVSLLDDRACLLEESLLLWYFSTVRSGSFRWRFLYWYFCTIVSQLENSDWRDSSLGLHHLSERCLGTGRW